jgi:hypothetical protein
MVRLYLPSGTPWQWLRRPQFAEGWLTVPMRVLPCVCVVFAWPSMCQFHSAGEETEGQRRKC